MLQSQNVQTKRYVFHDTNGRHPGQTLKTLWFLTNEFYMDIHQQDCRGSSYETWMGEGWRQRCADPKLRTADEAPLPAPVVHCTFVSKCVCEVHGPILSVGRFTEMHDDRLDDEHARSLKVQRRTRKEPDERAGLRPRRSVAKCHCIPFHFPSSHEFALHVIS